MTMISRPALGLLVLAAVWALAPPAASAAGRPAKPATAHAATRIAKPGSPRRVPSPRAAPAAAARDSARTLDAIHIEGELDVPEVLFITARDQRRIVEFQHRRYLKTAAEILRETPAPTRVVVARGNPQLAGEDPR